MRHSKSSLTIFIIKSPIFKQWYNRRSIGFSPTDRLTEAPTESSNKEKELAEENEKNLIHLSLFGSKCIQFNFDRALFSPVAESNQVVDIYKNILPADSNSPIAYYPTVDELFNKLKTSKSNQAEAQALFCGGPISSIRICPQRTKEGSF